MAQRKRKGVGTTIAKTFEATGVKAIVKHLVGEDCGCEQREEQLNEWGDRVKSKLKEIFRLAQPLKPEEYDYLKWWFSEKRTTMKPTEQNSLILINNRVLGQRMTATNCSSCLKELNDRLKRVFDAYEVND